MPFEKGHKKLGGRKKGVPNRLTNDLRTALKDILFEEIENIPNLLAEVPPKERMELLIKLMKYCLPIIRPVHSETGEPISFDF